MSTRFIRFRRTWYETQRYFSGVQDSFVSGEPGTKPGVIDQEHFAPFVRKPWFLLKCDSFCKPLGKYMPQTALKYEIEITQTGTFSGWRTSHYFCDFRTTD